MLMFVWVGGLVGGLVVLYWLGTSFGWPFIFSYLVPLLLKSVYMGVI